MAINDIGGSYLSRPKGVSIGDDLYIRAEASVDAAIEGSLLLTGEAAVVWSIRAFKAFRGAKGGVQLLYRRGARDSSKLLKNQAQAAEKSSIGIHGVSVSSSSVTTRVGQLVRCASCSQLEKAGFKVHKTGRDPNHYTVELPSPVTKEVSKAFNDVFK